MATPQPPNGRSTLALPILSGVAFVVISLLAFPTVGAGEEFEALHCYAGTATAFHGSQELKSLSTFSMNGIMRSPNKPFDNAATHCEGVARAGEVYGLCKIVDGDGDIVVWGGPSAGSKYTVLLLEGTGKWKGITGSIDSERVALATKPAVPGSFHMCSQWKGKFEIRK
jgi:hypothetical protein